MRTFGDADDALGRRCFPAYPCNLASLGVGARSTEPFLHSGYAPGVLGQAEATSREESECIYTDVL